MKKVLVITYYWPPSAGGGVQRWLKFCKYLPENGWTPIVFTPENPQFDVIDRDLESDIPPEIDVIRFPIWEPYRIADKVRAQNTRRLQGIPPGTGGGFWSPLLRWIRGNAFIPDPRRFWVRPSVEFLVDIILTNNIKVVVTSGPPHSMHLIGNRLRKRTGIKWVADFRDPWSRWDMLRNFAISSWALRQHQKMERTVLSDADMVITVSPQWANEFRELAPAGMDPGKIEVLTNGYDEDDFPPTATAPKQASKFTISHAGLINSFRDPGIFLEALKEVIAEYDDFRDSCELVFAGMMDPGIKDRIQNDPLLKGKVVIKGYLSHRQVISLYKESAMLLLLMNDTPNAKGHIPGKLFEYLAAKRPVLGLGNVRGDAADIINSRGMGCVCSYDERLAIKNAIIHFFSDHKKGNFLKPQNVEDFSRGHLTQRLAALLDGL